MTAEAIPEAGVNGNTVVAVPAFSEPAASPAEQPTSQEHDAVESVASNDTKPQQRDAADLERQRRARAAAIAAVAHAAPGQRERVMNEAIAAASALVPDTAAAPAAPPAEPQYGSPFTQCHAVSMSPYAPLKCFS